MNSAVSAQLETVEAVALRVSKQGRAIRNGAEYDDLVQEGLIQVWQNLERGVDPQHYVEFRMLDYVRWLGLQIGVSRRCEKAPELCPQHVPYEAMLPMDDFRSQDSDGEAG
jgi:DNA-directed RNA polymerase specialized sigma subunit